MAELTSITGQAPADHGGRTRRSPAGDCGTGTEKDMEIVLEQLTHDNYPHALLINRDDVPEEWVDTAASLMETTNYGAEHHLAGHTFLAYLEGKPVGLIMIGEALGY